MISCNMKPTWTAEWIAMVSFVGRRLQPKRCFQPLVENCKASHLGAVVSVQNCRVSDGLFTLVKMMELFTDEGISGWMVKHFAEVRECRW